jgi:hypothetical protein
VVNSHPLYQLSYRGIIIGNLSESQFSVNEIVKLALSVNKHVLDKGCGYL